MKLKRHIVIPAALLIYVIVMAYIGRDALLIEKKYLQYFGSLAIELAVIIALGFVIKKRDKLREERRRDIESRQQRDSLEKEADK